MRIDYLSWDSTFFGLSISKVIIEKEDDIRLFSEMQSNGSDLYYIFSPFPLGNLLSGAKLVDIKRVYSKPIDISIITNSVGVESFSKSDSIFELYSLAYASGVQSRFKIDHSFPKDSFERLYSLWVDKSLRGELADKVFVSKEEGRINGFVTVRESHGQGSIGLIATSESSRRKGIGSRLLTASESYLASKGSKVMTIATQKANVPACHFYEKMGYKVVSDTMIYHLWK